MLSRSSRNLQDESVLLVTCKNFALIGKFEVLRKYCEAGLAQV